MFFQRENIDAQSLCLMFSSSTLLSGCRRLVDRIPQPRGGSSTWAWCSLLHCFDKFREGNASGPRMGVLPWFWLWCWVSRPNIFGTVLQLSRIRKRPPSFNDYIGDTCVYGNVGGKNLLFSRMWFSTFPSKRKKEVRLWVSPAFCAIQIQNKRIFLSYLVLRKCMWPNYPTFTRCRGLRHFIKTRGKKNMFRRMLG